MKDKDTPVSEMADTTMKNYEHALRTSLKFQEETGRLWSSMLNQASLGQDWQNRLSSMAGMANRLVPMAQHRMQDMLHLMEKNGRTGAELMKKAVEAAQTPVLAESQAKWLEFWASSLGAVRSSTEAVTEISNRAIDSWIEFLRENGEVSEPRAGKTA
jgi:hypothetical protein